MLTAKEYLKLCNHLDTMGNIPISQQEETTITSPCPMCQCKSLHPIAFEGEITFKIDRLPPKRKHPVIFIRCESCGFMMMYDAAKIFPGKYPAKG